MAILRTLGIRMKDLVMQISMRTMLFSVPGIITGFAVMLLLTNAVVLAIYYLSNFEIYTEVDWSTIFTVRSILKSIIIGTLCGIAFATVC